MRLRAEGAVLALALPLALPGCRTVESIDLQPPNAPAPKGSYGACTATPSVLARLPGVLPALRADEFNLYALTAEDAGSQSVWRVPKDGSTPAKLATTRTAITSLCVVSTNYLTTQGVLYTSADDPAADGGPTGAVWSVGLDAGDRARILVANRRAPTALVAVGAQMYWAEQRLDLLGNPEEAIFGAPISGSPVTWINAVAPSEAPTGIAVSAPHVAQGEPGFFFGGELVWTTATPQNEGSAEVIVCPLTGSFAPLARYGGVDAGGAGGIAVGPYSGIEASLPGAVVTFDQTVDAGYALAQTLASTTSNLGAFADDGVDLFFVQPGTRNLVAVPRHSRDASQVRTVLSDVGSTLAFEVDSTCVYWVDVGTAALAMVVAE